MIFFLTCVQQTGKSVHSFPFSCCLLMSDWFKHLTKTSKKTGGVFLLIFLDFRSELQYAERLNSSITFAIPSNTSDF